MFDEAVGAAGFDRREVPAVDAELFGQLGLGQAAITSSGSSIVTLRGVLSAFMPVART